jgi:Methylase of polypeptide chain release factors
MKSALRATAERYRPWPNLYYYARGKLALDPAYPAVARELASSPRPLLDIGCGMGLLAAWLRAHGHRAPIVGMDVDDRKIRIARDLLGAEGAAFHTGDALDSPRIPAMSSCSTCCIISTTPNRSGCLRRLPEVSLRAGWP